MYPLIVGDKFSLKCVGILVGGLLICFFPCISSFLQAQHTDIMCHIRDSRITNQYMYSTVNYTLLFFAKQKENPFLLEDSICAIQKKVLFIKSNYLWKFPPDQEKNVNIALYFSTQLKSSSLLNTPH